MKTIMNNLTASAVAIVAMLMGAASFAADAVNDPRAEIFRAAGCDAEFLKPVTNANGDVLYWANTHGKGCDASKVGGYREDLERQAELDAVAAASN